MEHGRVSKGWKQADTTQSGRSGRKASALVCACDRPSSCMTNADSPSALKLDQARIYARLTAANRRGRLPPDTYAGQEWKHPATPLDGAYKSWAYGPSRLVCRKPASTGCSHLGRMRRRNPPAGVLTHHHKLWSPLCQVLGELRVPGEALFSDAGSFSPPAPLHRPEKGPQWEAYTTNESNLPQHPKQSATG